MLFLVPPHTADESAGGQKVRNPESGLEAETLGLKIEIPLSVLRYRQ